MTQSTWKASKIRKILKIRFMKKFTMLALKSQNLVSSKNWGVFVFRIDDLVNGAVQKLQRSEKRSEATKAISQLKSFVINIFFGIIAMHGRRYLVARWIYFCLLNTAFTDNTSKKNYIWNYIINKGNQKGGREKRRRKCSLNFT